MELRNALNQRPALVGGVVLTVAAIAIAFSAWRVHSIKTDLPVFPDQQFYTSDGGATWFADKDDRIPPFDFEGKQAVLALVYSCDGGKHKWVQYLQKYDDRAREQLTELREGKALPQAGPGPLAGIMIKPAGTGRWVYQSDRSAQAIMNARCPDGDTGPVKQELP
jgi:hypothetical protein